ncbi:DHH family phosphoesterase [Candidatus Woesearchaeota archaeon]|jgi:single-stranded DNA-specific DHH superfamily exonuclease|nr:DHH family phosphoesterase [Candidatus Woesearchaeota archaeon]MBT6519072.1 DHH family phosphoesterase [Candidatus Woesearchaeota archaeon]MBT7366864.1 DHH family phosphoesterase [Candidatus Woesearchaeota archaeon]
MPLTEKQNKQILDELDHCNRPLYFFHDDTDGLCSFLLFYRYKLEGKGVCVKAQPIFDKRFFNIIQSYCPDKIFVVDVPQMDQDFIDELNRVVKVPIIWVDHHPPMKINGVKYFNPRIANESDGAPASKLCYDVVKKHRPEDLWIAVVGFVGDWTIQPDLKDFAKQYPDLMSATVKKPEEALFNSGLSKVIKLMNFILKGNTKDVMKCVKILTRVTSPYEILNNETSQVHYLWKRFDEVNEVYEELLGEAVELFEKEKSKLVVYIYKENKLSLSGDLSNELLYKFPEKVLIISRQKSGEMKMSLRSSGNILIPPILKKALEGVEGYGGGHEHACGACVKVRDFEKFLNSIRSQVD